MRKNSLPSEHQLTHSAMCSFAWLPPSFDASARDDVFRTPGRGGSTHTHNPSFRPPADVSETRGTPQTEEGKYLGGDPRPCQGRSSRVVYGAWQGRTLCGACGNANGEQTRGWTS